MANENKVECRVTILSLQEESEIVNKNFIDYYTRKDKEEDQKTLKHPLVTIKSKNKTLFSADVEIELFSNMISSEIGLHVHDSIPIHIWKLQLLPLLMPRYNYKFLFVFV